MYVDHRDAASFLDKCEGHLLQAEAENALVLGIARSIHDDTSKFASPGSPAPRFGHVEIDGSICTTVLQTPPFQLLTTRGEPENMAALADGVLGHGWDGPGVQGEAASVRFFGEAWCASTGQTLKSGMKSRGHVLHKVVMPTLPLGRARPAEKPDVGLLAGWIEAFAEEVDTAVSRDAREVAENGVKTGRLWVWDHEGPVSIAGWGNATDNAMQIGTVYTPPALRGKGYASAVTASLSKYLLEQGFSFCCLYTDLANPTSTKIYRQIGYEPVWDSRRYSFE